MITDHDRSGYIGASDTDKVIGNWKTKTWEKWWMEKLGYAANHFENRYTQAGTNFEHRILQSLNIPGMRLDEQIIHENLRLRVNYDGMTDNCIFECKTYQWEKGFKVPKKYIHQVQVQMFAKGIHQGKIIAYGLEEEDYQNFLRPIDPRRLQEIPVTYEPGWIADVYLPKLRILADCLKKGVFPDEAR